MFTNTRPAFDRPPPPSGFVPSGQAAVAVDWVADGFATPLPMTTEYSFGARAHTARTSKVVVAPLALLTSPTQPLSRGNELLMLASVLSETMDTPPPSGTRPAGHVTTPRVCWPLTATSWPDRTTV